VITSYFDISRNIVDTIRVCPYFNLMEHETVAKCLAELGNPTRLAIFRYLVKAGPEGAPVGKIQKEIGVPASTLSHHISRLVSVGLLRQVRESRVLHCLPQFEVLNELIAFLMAECCAESDCCVPALMTKDSSLKKS
jgi:ArsR family transcriptional regulator